MFSTMLGFEEAVGGYSGRVWGLGTEKRLWV